jgi:hypothetical protein
MMTDGKMLNYLLHHNLLIELQLNRKDIRSINNRQNIINIFDNILEVYTTTENHDNAIALYSKPLAVHYFINSLPRKTNIVNNKFCFSHILTQNATRSAYMKKQSIFKMKCLLTVKPILKYLCENENIIDLQNVKQDILKKNYINIIKRNG